jgi:hypothetical protein
MPLIYLGGGGRGRCVAGETEREIGLPNELLLSPGCKFYVIIGLGCRVEEMSRWRRRLVDGGAGCRSLNEALVVSQVKLEKATIAYCRLGRGVGCHFCKSHWM